MENIKNERGSVLIELVFACMILLMLFYACAETFFLVRDRLLLERIVRDGARETTITGSVNAGRDKADDRANQFFGSKAYKVDTDVKHTGSGGAEAVVCTANYSHEVFGNLFGEGIGEVDLSAKAVFCWKDYNI